MTKTSGIAASYSQEEWLDSRALRDLLHISSTQLWDRRKAGKLPEPDVRLGKRTFMWRRATIDSWLESCRPAAGEGLA